jgi:hypothetical protein
VCTSFNRDKVVSVFAFSCATSQRLELPGEEDFTDFFDLRTHAKQNNRINFLTIRKMKFCMVD